MVRLFTPSKVTFVTQLLISKNDGETHYGVEIDFGSSSRICQGKVSTR
jgi:hypothetical protein